MGKGLDLPVNFKMKGSGDECPIQNGDSFEVGTGVIVYLGRQRREVGELR